MITCPASRHRGGCHHHALAGGSVGDIDGMPLTVWVPAIAVSINVGTIAYNLGTNTRNLTGFGWFMLVVGVPIGCLILLGLFRRTGLHGNGARSSEASPRSSLPPSRSSH